MKWFAPILVVGLFSGKLFAQDCRCESVDGSVESIFDADTQNGQHMRLRFEEDPVTMKTKLGFLCTDATATVNQAKLWMPQHGHGSSPTKLVAAGRCTRIEKINFVMEGPWEIRVTLSDGDKGTFTVDVTK